MIIELEQIDSIGRGLITLVPFFYCADLVAYIAQNKYSINTKGRNNMKMTMAT